MPLSILLALVAGWVDTVVYFTLGLFAAHVTGNIVLVFDALRRPSPNILLGAISVPIFMLVAFLAALLGQTLGPQRPRTLRLLFALEAGLLAACLAAGIRLIHPGDQAAAGPLITGLLGVSAMAVQNATNRLLPALPSTAVMTSNVSQTAVDLARLLCAHEQRGEVTSRLQRTVAAVLAFAVGCAFGAGTFALAGFWSLAGPVLLLATVAASVRPDPA